MYTLFPHVHFYRKTSFFTLVSLSTSLTRYGEPSVSTSDFVRGQRDPERHLLTLSYSRGVLTSLSFTESWSLFLQRRSTVPTFVKLIFVNLRFVLPSLLLAVESKPTYKPNFLTKKKIFYLYRVYVKKKDVPFKPK